MAVMAQLDEADYSSLISSDISKYTDISQSKSIDLVPISRQFS